MSRWYYTDPLAAAWMIEKFGMKVTGPLVSEKEEVYESSWPIPVSLIYRIIERKEMRGDTSVDKYYIHPDSLPLLEPKVGDTISGVALNNRLLQEVIEGTVENNIVWVRDRGCKIIQRNGLPFMWPEQEKE